MRQSLGLLLTLVLSAACGRSTILGSGTYDPPDACASVANSAPAMPTIETPVSGRIDVIADQLRIAATPFYDPDGDGYSMSEFEIWSASADGSISIRAWSARFEGASPPTSVTLDDGVFDAIDGALKPWTDYVVRARYRDAGQKPTFISRTAVCETWSEWSEPRLFRTDDGSSYLFGTDDIRDLYIEIPPDSWAAIDQQARPPGCVPFERDYYGGHITFEGERLEDVGIRSKGGCGSARHLNGKTAFKINLEWDDPAVPGCPADRRLHGLQHLTLNNMVQDRSYLHEQLGYSLHAELGVPTPRVNYMRVHVNGDLWGLYLLQESVDRRFLARRFESNQGSLYEGTYWCDLIPANIPPDLVNTYCFSRKFGKGTCSEPSDFEDLADLIWAIDGIPAGRFMAEAPLFLELDTFLTMWAIDAQLGHWDGYEFNIINNYRVYLDPATQRWSLIPTGIDQTFGSDVNPFAVSGILAQKCLQEAPCAAAFVDKLTLVNDTFQAMNFQARIDELVARITADVMADPRKEFAFPEFLSRVQSTRDFIETRPARMQAYIDSANARLAAGESLIAGTPFEPVAD